MRPSGCWFIAPMRSPSGCTRCSSRAIWSPRASLAHTGASCLHELVAEVDPGMADPLQRIAVEDADDDEKGSLPSSGGSVIDRPSVSVVGRRGRRRRDVGVQLQVAAVGGFEVGTSLLGDACAPPVWRRREKGRA